MFAILKRFDNLLSKTHVTGDAFVDAGGNIYAYTYNSYEGKGTGKGDRFI